MSSEVGKKKKNPQDYSKALEEYFKKLCDTC